MTGGDVGEGEGIGGRVGQRREGGMEGDSGSRKEEERGRGALGALTLKASRSTGMFGSPILQDSSCQERDSRSLS